LAMVSALIPWAGLQLLPFGDSIFLWLLIFHKWQFLQTIAVSSAGIIAGSAGLLVFYYANNALSDFITSILPHAANKATFSFSQSYGAFTDVSVLIAYTIIALWLWRAPQRNNKASLALCTLPILTLVILKSVSVAPLYYSIMAYPALGILVAKALTGLKALQQPNTWAQRLIPLSIYTLLAIIPVLKITAAVGKIPGTYYPAAAEFLAQHISAQDIVYSQTVSPYYAVQNQIHCSAYYYRTPLSTATLESINTLVLPQATLPEWLSDQGLSLNNYQLQAHYDSSKNRLLPWLNTEAASPGYTFYIYKKTPA
ncbi:MAG TPA: hypothetical protein PLV25_05585, partial [Opitutales bacterium]|nr:hypothetical protein [Opitutales bacterium]